MFELFEKIVCVNYSIMGASEEARFVCARFYTLYKIIWLKKLPYGVYYIVRLELFFKSSILCKIAKPKSVLVCKNRNNQVHFVSKIKGVGV